MRTSSLFRAKISDFSKFMMCQHGQGGLSQFGHFSDKGREGLIFRDFVRTARNILFQRFMKNFRFPQVLQFFIFIIFSSVF